MSSWPRHPSEMKLQISGRGPKKGVYLASENHSFSLRKKSDVMGFRNENAALGDCLSSDCERSAETSKSHIVRILDRGPVGIGSTVVKIGTWKEDLPTRMKPTAGTRMKQLLMFKGKPNL